MNKIINLLTGVMMIAAIGTISSCKKTFDSPPAPSDPNIIANTSIKALKALHTVSGALNVINTDLVISGVVVANDKSGNLYKQLFIQDSTGGLQILLEASSLYGSYPVGRRIFVKCNGLCISDYNGTMELGIKATVGGIPSVQGIPSNAISSYVLGGSINNPVVPAVVTLSQLTTGMQDKYLGTLIQLDGFAFTTPNATYADTSSYKNTVNLDIKNCTNNTVIVRSSGYANFAGTTVAQGRGSILAIYTTYGSTKQLLIRDTTDVRFTDPYACPLPAGTLLSEDFESIGANNLTLNIPTWKNIGEVGSVLYQNAVFGPVKCAKISAFSTGVATVSSWLISPPVSLAGAVTPKLSFTTSGGFNVGATTFKVFVSTNYNGSNTPSSSTWTQLPANIPLPPSSGFGTFASSGVLDLSAYNNQTIYVGFRYDGGDPSKTTTYELDDVKVLKN